MKTTAEERYLNDPWFHHLVDAIESLLREGKMTVPDIREAATLAEVKHENRRFAGEYDNGLR